MSRNDQADSDCQTEPAHDYFPLLIARRIDSAMALVAMAMNPFVATAMDQIVAKREEIGSKHRKLRSYARPPAGASILGGLVVVLVRPHSW